MKPITRFVISALLLELAACGGGKGSTATQTTPPPPPPSIGSSASSSGSTGVFTANGATYALTPAPAAAGATGASAKLLTLPNTGNAVGVVAVTNVTSTPIPTSLTTTINGTSVDPANNVGMAFSYNNSKISIFGLPSHPTKPKVEISTYDTLTVNNNWYSGALAKIVGAIMNTANKTLILGTADGFEVVDYSNPAALIKLREIPSIQVNAASGVEVMENFAFDPKLTIAGIDHAMIITGGRYSRNVVDPAMTLVDANTGSVYKPDTATAALFTTSQYIDAAAVDTTYHVAVLADESTGTTFVDLTKLTFNATTGTYTLPAAAVSRITTYFKYDNLAIESTKHLVMIGAGMGGTSMVVGLLKNPATGLGFSKEVMVNMPSGTDDTGATISWSGSGDPHGASAYITDLSHPTYNNPTALGMWVNMTGSHVAIIDLQGVLDGALAAQVPGAPAYNPTATNPKDIAYFKIP